MLNAFSFMTSISRPGPGPETNNVPREDKYSSKIAFPLVVKTPAKFLHRLQEERARCSRAPSAGRGGWE